MLQRNPDDYRTGERGEGTMRSPAIRGSHPNGPYQKLVVWTQLITERRKSAEGSIPLRPTTIFVNVRECSVIAISPCFIRFRTGHYTTSCAISARAATPHRCRFGLMPQTLSRRAEHSLTFIKSTRMFLFCKRLVHSFNCRVHMLYTGRTVPMEHENSLKRLEKL